MSIVPKHFLCKVAVSTGCVLWLAGCGSGGSSPATTTAAKAKPPALASRPARTGEVVLTGEATPKTGGPYAFSGRYRVRFVQYAPEDPRHDFTADTPFVVDLERQQGLPVTHVFKAAASGGERVMRIAGRFYVDASFGDYPFAIRFTPVGK